MMHRRKTAKRLLALLLASTLALCASPAFAEGYWALVTANPLTIYANPTLDGATLQLGAYTVVNVSATQGTVAQLRNGPYTAYTAVSGLAPLTGTGYAVSNRATLVFERPTSISRHVALPKGFRMRLLYSNSTYAVVQNGNYIGYVVPSHITAEAAQGNNNGVVIETYEATVIVDGMPVYRSANTSQYMGSLPAGYGVTVYAQNGTWAYIGKNGNFGFCPLAALERGQGQGSGNALAGATKVTVTSATMNVYASPDTSSQLLGVLQRGVEVNLIRTEGSWAYIELNSRYGYCAVSDITSQSGDSNYKGEIIDGHEPLGTATVIQALAPVYASMSTSARYTTLRMGETVSFYGYDDNWVLVGRDGAFGFMPRSTLNALSYAELKLESSGAGVLQLENALLGLGYLDNIPTSNYTAVTATGVQRLQAAIGLSQTGNADLATLRVLYSGNAPASPLLGMTLSQGLKNENVSRLQSRLLALGYLSRQSSVDGDYGNNTASAVRLFQTAAGISATGTADSNTLRALYNASAPRLGSGQTAPDQSSAGSGGSSSGNTTDIPSGLGSTTSTYNPNSSNGQKLEYVIYVAQQQLGKRYVFGASGPSTFDCSGLTMYCFAKIGISLQHSAKGEGYNDSRPKISSVSSLLRGDLVFFNTVSDGDMCDHTGIYLGNGYCLHASSGAGKVIISSITSGYYNRVFSWGRRVLST